MGPTAEAFRLQANTVSIPLDSFIRPSSQPRAVAKVVDLFAGAGGFSLGFLLAGAHIQAAFELDDWAADTLECNHPGTPVVRGDLRDVSDEVVLSHGRGADVVIGGPPCQGYSVANNRAGDPSDPRNTLFMQFVRVAELLQPRAVILENVPGLLRRRTASGIPVIEVIKAEFRRVGYEPHVSVIQALDFGVPQIRPRLFVLGLRVATQTPFPLSTHAVEPNDANLFTPSSSRTPTLWEAISDLPDLEACQGGEEMPYANEPKTDLQRLLRAGSEAVFNHKAMRHSARLVERFATIAWGQSGSDAPLEHLARKRGSPDELSGKSYDQNNRRLFPDRPCHTIPASFYANFIHPYKHRNFTPREGARIQTFPDWYRFLGKPTVVSHKLLGREGREEELHLCQYNQIGNAVPPLLAFNLARHIFGLI